MAIKYQRDSRKPPVKPENLRPGQFYRNARDASDSPCVYIATDERTVVSLDLGVQYTQNLHNDYAEVNVEITVGGDA